MDVRNKYFNKFSMGRDILKLKSRQQWLLLRNGGSSSIISDGGGSGGNVKLDKYIYEATAFNHITIEKQNDGTIAGVFKTVIFDIENNGYKEDILESSDLLNIDTVNNKIIYNGTPLVIEYPVTENYSLFKVDRLDNVYFERI